MRRFIAGAVCPQCRAVDRIVVEDVDDAPAGAPGEGRVERRRRCVSCGYRDSLVTGAAIEPPARFDRRSGDDATVTRVRLLDRAAPPAPDLDDPKR